MKTEDLVQEWILARKSAEHQRLVLAQEECDLINAINALGNWIVPPEKEFRPENHLGEWFNIWIGSGVLRARSIPGDPPPHHQKFNVEWLREPDGKDRYEHGF